MFRRITIVVGGGHTAHIGAAVRCGPVVIVHPSKVLSRESAPLRTGRAAHPLAITERPGERKNP